VAAVTGIEGSIFERGDAGYEDARLAAVWNARKPDRFPDVIVQAVSDEDVVAAVRLAGERGLQVKARSGGHSWTASGVRDGLLIDLSRLTEITVDPGSRIATAQPGAKGRDLSERLRQHDLFFPGGHCPTVALGGFLLQGGWGWNGRMLGPACLSVRAVEVVTADGNLIRADSTQNTDFLWAARGAGAGYFGVVTRFHLDLHPRPAAIFAGADVYPLEVLDEVLTWALEVAPRLPPDLEFVILGTTPRLPDGTLGPGDTSLVVSGAALMETDEEALAALGFLDSCPVVERAIDRVRPGRVEMADLYAGADAVEPEGYRWAVDNMWTDAGAAELVPAVRELFETVPNGISHIFWYPWRKQPVPESALSVTGNLYIAAFAGWQDPAEDDRMLAWCTGQMRRLEPLSVGIQLADENLVNRRARFLSDENARLLEELRRKHDPERRFHSYLIASE
jgi:FAD/FMN-containing dehydrogenase